MRRFTTAALGEAAGQSVSHPLRLTMRLRTRSLCCEPATAARLADVTETTVQGSGAVGVQVGPLEAEPHSEAGRGERGAWGDSACM